MKITEKIAFIIGDNFIYWSPVILAIAAFAAICLFLSLYMGFTGKSLGGFMAVALSVVLGLVLGRLVHWYCPPNNYKSFEQAMGDLSVSTFALTGVFFACAISGAVVRIVRGTRNLPLMYDCMAVAGTLGIFVGRLSHFYNGTDVGMLVKTFTELPMAVEVGEGQYRLATFLLQAIVAGVLCAFLSADLVVGKLAKLHGDGSTALTFLLCYGCSQVILDSTRSDKLFLRSNGFVSMEQIIGAVYIVLAVVLFSIRMVRNRGWKWWFLSFWVGIAGLLTCAGIMEYKVQRHGNEAPFYYNIMALCLLGVIAIGIVLRILGAKFRGSQASGKFDKPKPVKEKKEKKAKKLPDMPPMTEPIVSEEIPEEETPVEEAPAEEAPTEEAPAEEASAEEAPTEEAPAEEAPTEEAPVKEAPAEEAPAEETPAEETSAEEMEIPEDPQ